MSGLVAAGIGNDQFVRFATGGNQMKFVVALLIVAFVSVSQSMAAAPPDNWKSLTVAGEKAYSLKNYVLARKLWTQALTQAEKLPPSDVRLAQSLDNMASVAKAQEKYAEAEKLYRRELDLRKKYHVKDEVVLGLNVINLASVIGSEGDYKRAKAVYNSEHKLAAPAASIKCYLCEERNSVVPIFYGNPGPQMKKLIKQGKVKLGGPIPKVVPENRWYCVTCDAPL
jgi:tetratricopeptide (TPR) repeat protein